MTSPTSTRRTARTRARAVLGLGLTSGLLVGLVSLMDFGDPRVEARADAVRDAEARARSIRLAWEALRRAPRLPDSVTERAVELDPDAALVLGAGVGPVSAPDRIVEVLLNAALAADVAGDAAGALATLEDALTRGPAGPRASLVRYHAARLAGQLGDEESVLRHRAALANLDADAVHEGTSTRLLAALVPPVDARAAFDLLTGGAAVLPTPRDGVTETLELVPDPWWAALREPLRAAARELDWDLAFQTRARLAAALRLRLDEPAEDATWTFERLGDALVAQRRDGKVWTAAAVDPGALLAELESDESSVEDEPYAVLAGRADPGEPLRAPAPLDGTDLAFAIHHPDPEAAAAGELRRIRVLRAALVALAGALVLAATVAARAMSRAARLAELRSTFVASVSHDLRTPTQAILLMAETLEQGRIATPESRGRYFTQIRKEAHRLRRLVEDLLDSARIDRGAGARVERRTVDAAAFLDDLETALEERAASAGAALSITRGAMPETLEIDPDSVHRAVWNLFENALLHGGSADGNATVRVTFEVAGDALECAVHDDGDGIPARHRETVFEAFERLRDRDSRGGIDGDTGTGLGLAIVRALSRAHGGDARVAPTERGAKVVATFPLREDGSSEGAA